MTTHTPSITFTIPMTPENKQMIDAVTAVMANESYMQNEDTDEDTKSEGKQGVKVKVKPKPRRKLPGKPNQDTQHREDTSDTVADVPSVEELKAAAKEAKSVHGADFVNSVMDDHGIEAGDTLGKRMRTIPKSIYRDLIDEWDKGPAKAKRGSKKTKTKTKSKTRNKANGKSAPGDTIDPEAVRTALKAYARTKGRGKAQAIMQANGAERLSKIENCDQDQLAAMMGELV